MAFQNPTRYSNLGYPQRQKSPGNSPGYDPQSGPHTPVGNQHSQGPHVSFQNGQPLERSSNFTTSAVNSVRPFRETESHSRHHRGTSTFDTIRADCLRRGVLYEDPEFLAQDSSVYFSRSPPFRLDWKRPPEIANYHRQRPVFIHDNSSRFDAVQGELGDCWVVSAIACLSGPDHRELFRRVVPADQGFQDGSYAGIFRFNFWHFGKWKEVVIDDRLPTDRGNLIFVQSHQRNEFWAALLEKAYAKLYGSYEALKSGNVGDALTDFSGGLTEAYTLRGPQTNVPRNIVNILFKALDRQSLIGCGIGSVKGRSGTESILPSGLVAGHAYSITDLREILLMSDQGEIPITLVRVRNPWGSKVEWSGAWGDRSREWNSIPQPEREKMGLVFRDDGEFWMEFGDFLHNFDSLDICNLTPDSPIEMPKQWHIAEYHGRWVKGFSAGGRPKHRDSHWTNPQYKVILSDSDEDDDNSCSFIIQLMQKDKRKMKQSGKKNLHIGFLVYKYIKSYPLPLKKEYFDNNPSVESSKQFIDSREIVTRMILPPGEYVVVPCAWDPSEEADFYLRFFFENRNSVENTDESPERVDVPVPPAPPENDKEEQFKRFFYSVSGEDMEVNPYELQQVLNDAFRQEPLHSKISIDSCKTFINLLDVDDSGKLGYTEFLYLWNLIRTWKKLYYQFDKDRSGMLSSYELRLVLGAAGFKVNNSTMQALIFRFSNEKSEVDLNSYLTCLAKLMKLFSEFNSSKQNDHMTVTLSQWLEKSITL